MLGSVSGVHKAGISLVNRLASPVGCCQEYFAFCHSVVLTQKHSPSSFCISQSIFVLAVFSKFGCFCAVRLLLFSFRYISHNHVPRLNAVLA